MAVVEKTPGVDDVKAKQEITEIVKAAAAVESAHGVGTKSLDTTDIQTINKANAAVSSRLGNATAGILKLTKSAFGSVAGVLGVFGGLKRIMGGI